METLILEAQKRDTSANLNAMRRNEQIPGIVYGHGFENINVSVAQKELEKTYNQTGHSAIVKLKVDQQEIPVLIHAIQRDPVYDRPLHVDFYHIRMDEKITTTIRIVFEGESSAVKDLGGVLVKTMDELEVEALPGDLPPEIKVDISVLQNFDDAFKVRDLVVPKKIKILAEPETIVAMVQAPRAEEPEEAPAPTLEEVEVITKEKKESEEVIEEKNVEK